MFSEDNQRLFYFKNYETIHIIPPLHRSTISFVGMQPREYYLAVKKCNNRFYALDKNNRITTWNALTGKLCMDKTVQGFDYSKYMLFGKGDRKKNKDYTYSKDWHKPLYLLVSSEEALNGINTGFIDKLNPLNEIKDCVGYVEQETNQIQFRNFVIIEIEDERHVTQHFQFVHQYYNDKIQRMVISKDCSLMIEKLVNLRVLVYERKFNETSKTFEWDLRKRFYDYPHELSDKSQSMYLFSPNLRKFIDYNIELQAFVLKDTL